MKGEMLPQPGSFLSQGEREAPFQRTQPLAWGQRQVTTAETPALFYPQDKLLHNLQDLTQNEDPGSLVQIAGGQKKGFFFFFFYDVSVNMSSCFIKIASS